MKIQALHELDQAQWLPLWMAYQEFYKVTLSDVVTQQTWQKLSDIQCTHMYGFAAVHQGQMVGIVHIVEHDSCWTQRPYAYLQDLYVDPSQRQKGIARSLIQHVGLYCQSRCDRVYWLTHDTNHTAKAVYDKVAKQTGFIQYRLNPA